MQRERPYVVSVAGFDPSSGAGVSADLKTFEQLHVYGLAVCTAYTLQTHDHFHSIEWRSSEKIIDELRVLLEAYPVKAVKTGIVASPEVLSKIITTVNKKDPFISIVVDPVWKSGTGFEFNTGMIPESLLEKVTLITPNVPEAETMGYAGEDKLLLLSQVTGVLLKGGHDASRTGVDLLYSRGKKTVIPSSQGEVKPKHGSGCVLASAITAYLALGYDLKAACTLAKKYIDRFLTSTESLLGYHAS